MLGSSTTTTRPTPTPAGPCALDRCAHATTTATPSTPAAGTGHRTPARHPCPPPYRLPVALDLSPRPRHKASKQAKAKAKAKEIASSESDWFELSSDCFRSEIASTQNGIFHSERTLRQWESEMAMSFARATTRHSSRTDLRLRPSPTRSGYHPDLLTSARPLRHRSTPRGEGPARVTPATGTYWCAPRARFPRGFFR